MIREWLQALLTPSTPSTMRELAAPEHWEAARAASHEEPVFIFKHSTACPISAAALQRVEAYKAAHADGPEFVMVKVIESRPVSNAIANDLGVEHRSPQLILLRDDACVAMHSHHGINEGNIAGALTPPAE